MVNFDFDWLTLGRPDRVKCMFAVFVSANYLRDAARAAAEKERKQGMVCYLLWGKEVHWVQGITNYHLAEECLKYNRKKVRIVTIYFNSTS